MKSSSPQRLFARLPLVGLALLATSLAACSGGASAPPATGSGGTNATAGMAGTSGGGAGTTAAAGTSGGGAGTTAAAGTSGGGAGTTAAAGTSGGGAGTTAAAGTTGTAGTTATTPDGSADTGSTTTLPVFTGIAKMMVLGSSNEIGTCWRAYLWQELQMNGITNFDFVGQQKGGPNCGITAWNDTELQAMSGIIITGLPAATYASWFKANPPDVILMHFGGADILAAKPVDGVMASYTVALEQARLVNPKVILLIAQHTPEGKDDIITLNADIATWAVQKNTATSPVIAVDLYTGMLASDFSDGVHLNMSGSMKVADRWYKALKPFFKP